MKPAGRYIARFATADECQRYNGNNGVIVDTSLGMIAGSAGNVARARRIALGLNFLERCDFTDDEIDRLELAFGRVKGPSDDDQ